MQDLQAPCDYMIQFILTSDILHKRIMLTPTNE